MYENGEQNVKPTASTSGQDDTNDPTQVKSKIAIEQDSESSVEKDQKSIEGKSNACEQIASVDVDVAEKSNTSVDSLKEDSNQSNQIKIVAVETATTDKSVIREESVEQEIDGKSTGITKSTVENTANSESHVVKSTDERNETRVISLDTIIRKGLNEQMPLTAKDIDNIVPNAIKKQQDANLKQSEMIAKEKELNIAYDSSDDDYDNSSDDDEKFEDEIVEAEVHVHVHNEQSQSSEKATNSEIENVVEATGTETVNNDSVNVPINKASLEVSTPPIETIKDKEKSLKDINDIEVDMEGINSNESENSTSDQSFDDFSSESDTTNSSRKKTHKRRKSWKTPNQFRDDVSKKSDGMVDETTDFSERKLNRRGKPRKSYDETDIEQVKKKVGRKLKIQRYSGPKRPPGRPKRDDGLSCYKDLNPKNTSSCTTPMDELMALGHSLFSEFVPKKPGRENFITEITTDAEHKPTNELTTDTIVQVHHNIDDQSTHPQLMFKRKPGRPKIDKESGGHIVFQNSELTVVNKPTKIKGEIIDPQDENGLASMVHTKDISIVPITKSLNKDFSRGYNLPVETTITSYGHNRSYQDPKIRNLKKESGYIDDSMLMAPLDEMLEVHHVEEYIPEIYEDKRRRGRKPKIERSTYCEMILSEPYVLNNDKPLNKPNNGPGISVKKIEDLLEIPTRKPTLQDFSYPELTMSTTNKSASNSNLRLNPVQSQIAHRAINKRIRGSRLSGSQPIYAELSESSNDVPEDIERNQSKPRKVHWKQQKKIKAAMKPHWTTQWKANLLSAANKPVKNENVDGKKVIATDTTSTNNKAKTEQTPSNSTKPIEPITPKTEPAHKEFDESVKELLQTRQKRIPKLKYSSYDFKVRRDPNKPKMVLKFKKKYYKKKKGGATTPNQSQDSHELPSVPQTENEPPVKIIRNQDLSQSQNSKLLINTPCQATSRLLNPLRQQQKSPIASNENMSASLSNYHLKHIKTNQMRYQQPAVIVSMHCQIQKEN